MTSFYNGENHLLQTLSISDAMCEDLEETKSSYFNERVVMVACHGEPLGRFLNILLSGRCSYLNMGLMNRMTLESWAALGSGIRSSLCLKHLVIGFTDLPPHAMKGLSSGLHQAKSLVRLHFNDMVWEADDDNDLAVALQSNQHLKVLSLAGCGLSDERVAAFVRAVKGHPRLEQLRLSGNLFGPETSEALSELLQEKESTLREIYLDNERYQHKRHRAKLDFGILSQALKYNTSLKALDLSDNLMDDHEFNLLAKALVPNPDGSRHNQTLEKLVLVRNRITDAGFSQFLRESLLPLRGLKKLSLWGNLMEVSIRKSSRSRDDKRMVLKNRVIRTMMELEDVELLKAVAFPEQMPLALWPYVLKRAEQVHRCKQERTGSPVDAVFLMLRGPMMMAALIHQAKSS